MKCSAALAFALALLVVNPDSGQGKEGYNLWTKERIRYLLKRSKSEPDNVDLLVMLSMAYYNDSQPRTAEKHLRRALELEPEYAKAHCNLAVMLHAQRRLGDARLHYEAALAADSTMVEAMAGLGTLLCRTDREGRGIDYLERVLFLDPSRLKTRYNLAVAYHQVGDFTRSIAHLRTLLTEQPAYPGGRQALAQAYFSRGLNLLQAKKPQASLEFFRRALENDRDDDDFHFAAGIAHMRLGDMSQAELAFSAAIELNEEHVPALHNLATVYERTGQTAAALRCYDRVRVLAPHIESIEAAREATYDETYLME